MSDTLPPLPPPDGMCELPLASGKWFDAYCARTVKAYAQSAIAAVEAERDALKADVGPLLKAVADLEAERDALRRIADVFGIGSAARTPDTILANVENAARRAACLSAIEREFFTPPDGDSDEDIEDCPLSWGASPVEYVEQFRAALKSASPGDVPPVEPTRAQRLREAGITPRKTGKTAGGLMREESGRPACQWTLSDADASAWATECGHIHSIIDGTPATNGMRYCCYCGGSLPVECGADTGGTGETE